MDGGRTIVGLGEALWDVLPGGRVLGGAPLNVACHVQALFQDALAVVASRVGTDALGDDVVRELGTSDYGDWIRAAGRGPCDQHGECRTL